MIFYLIGIALILLVSIYMNKISTKIGLPAVLAFIYSECSLEPVDG